MTAASDRNVLARFECDLYAIAEKLSQDGDRRQHRTVDGDDLGGDLRGLHELKDRADLCGQSALVCGCPFPGPWAVLQEADGRMLHRGGG